MDCFIKRESNKSFRIKTKKNRAVYLEFKLYCYSNKWHFNSLHIVGMNFWMLYVIVILAGKEAFVFIFLCSLWQLLQRIINQIARRLNSMGPLYTQASPAGSASGSLLRGP